MGLRVKAIALFLLSALSCFSQAFTFNDLAFVCQTNVTTPAAWAPTNAFGWWHADGTNMSDGTLVTWLADSASTHTLFVWTNAPYFTNNLINSKPGMRFTFSTPTLLTNSWGSTLSQPYTIVMLIKPDLRTSGNPNTVMDGLPSHGHQFKIDQASAHYYPVISAMTDQEGNTSMANLAWQVVTVCFNQANSFVRTNGVLWFLTSSTIGTNTSTGLTIGGSRLPTGGTSFNGWMTEIIFYNGLPATNDMQWVESNLKTKYGL